MVLSSETLLRQLDVIHLEALAKIKNISSVTDAESIRLEYFGKKGKISEIAASLKHLDVEAKKLVGQKLHGVRQAVETAFTDVKSRLELDELNQALKADPLDASAPGLHFVLGASHPIRLALIEARQVLEKAGLLPVYGPEVEYEDFCFDKLNFKPGHAARDMQATFFVKSSSERKLVLRTHTSPVQVRMLMKAAAEGHKLPIRIQVPGRVYRMDDDSTHSPMFHQIEGLAVDQTSSMGDLRAVLDYFFRKFFEDESLRVRFRPSYFPFTEPSAEVDLSCVFCKGKGCRTCKSSGWLEVAGAGLVHPEVFEACGWDASKVQGWAFGLGIERLAMLKFRIPDLRLFFENRLSFLRGRSA